ncbi:MAG: phage tail protein [Betaproteobacteria bacterium]|nr:phage tail protein [Betaproteobacteria bacterium]
MTDALNLYPPTGFRFTVSFGQSASSQDSSFQEVSGIGPQMETETVSEGGENRYVHTLPKAVKHPKLVLKRGIAALQSQLIVWCKSVLEGGLSKAITPKFLHVFLLDEKGEALRAWSFENAFPVQWEIDPFNSTKNEVAVEKITLSYAFSTRVV